VLGDENQVSTNYPDLPRVVKPGTRMLLDDGALSLIVESTTDKDVVCRVIDGGMLAERKGINLPGVELLEARVVENREVIVVMAGWLSGLGLSSSVTIFTVGGELGPTR
jgi:pyruvate kinase